MSTVETLERPAVQEASNPYLRGNFAPVTVETTAFDLPVTITRWQPEERKY